MSLSGILSGVLRTVGRGIALFFGVFAMTNIVGDLRFARANSNLWWLDLWPLPLLLARIVMVAIVAALVSCALRRDVTRIEQRTRRALVLFAAVAALIS